MKGEDVGNWSLNGCDYDEYKEIRNKTIDEFAERLKAEHEGMITNLGIPYAITFEKIDEVTEEMKAGGE